ncbi:MAG: DNA polymerase IV [Halobacteriota archaeon]|nr:DNA polymerase IV [Halobacteriota archaeon]
MGRIIIHVDLDSFYASLEESRNEKIRGKAVVICMFSGRSEDSGAVSAANYKARELGIKSGMSIVNAKRLAKGSGDVIFLPADREYYRTVSDRIMGVLEDEADLMQQVSVDEAYLDITEKTRKSWDGAKRIAEEIKERIKREEYLTCSVGIGPNKLIAKMASKHRKPDGLTVIKEEDIEGFLGGLPVSKLHGVGKKTTDALSELGVKTVDELAKTDPMKLEEAFGRNKAKALHDMALGIDDSPVEGKDARQISRIATLKEDTRDVETIFEKIIELTDEMEKKLKGEGVSFRTVSIILIDTHLKMQTRSETIPQTENVLEILPVARSLLERFLEENPEKVLRRVGIRVSNLTREKEKGQRTLFEF